MQVLSSSITTNATTTLNVVILRTFMFAASVGAGDRP